MNEHNRLRLSRITARYDARRRTEETERTARDEESSFLAAFDAVGTAVMRPLMEEISAELRRAGHGGRAEIAGPEERSRIDWYVSIAGRSTLTNRIRFFAQRDAEKGWQVIAEIEITHAPMELARFGAPGEITRDVAEQLLVDAVEQLFAYAGSNAEDRDRIQ